VNPQARQLLDLVADLCWLAQRRPGGDSPLPYTLPAGTALARAVRLGARGPRVADLGHWLATLGAGARWEAAA